MWTLAIVGSAWAHPFGDRFAAVATGVTIGRDAVSVTVVADVPRPLIAATTGHEDGADRLLEVMPTALQIDLSGEPIEPTVTGHDHAPDLVTGHAEILTFHAEVPLPDPGEHTVRLRHGILAATPTWLRADVRVPATAVVVGTSLDARRGDPRHLLGTWTRSRRPRDLSVTMALADHPLARWLDDRLPGRLADDARPVDPWSRWRTGRVDHHTLPGVLALGAVLVAASGPGASRRWVVACGGGGAVAGWAIGPWAGPLGVGLGLAALALAWTPAARSRGLAAAPAMAWLVGSVPAGVAPLTGVVAAMALVSALGLSGASDRTRLVGSILALAALTWPGVVG